MDVQTGRLELIGQLDFINALQFTCQAQRAPMFLHLLVVVVQSAYREVSRGFMRVKNDDALASTAPRRPNLD